MLQPQRLLQPRNPFLVGQAARVGLETGADQGIPLQQEDAFLDARAPYKFFSSPTLAATSSSIFWLRP